MTITHRPAVTVVIPVHNQRRYIADTIESVVASDPTVDVEVIVVDDCSSDGTDEVLATFGARIAVLRPSRNLERGACRNLGAMKAAAPLIAFVDADDVWLPGKLKAQIPVASRGNATTTWVERISESGAHLGRVEYRGQDASSQILTHNLFVGGPSSLLIPRDLFMEVGGFPEQRELQGSEDWLFFARLVRSGHRVVVVEEALAQYREHPAQSTSNPSQRARSMWAAAQWLETQGLLDADQRRRTFARTAGVVARGYAAAGRWGDALTWLGTSFRQGDIVEAGRALALCGASGSKALVRGFRS